MTVGTKYRKLAQAAVAVAAFAFAGAALLTACSSGSKGSPTATPEPAATETAEAQQSASPLPSPSVTATRSATPAASLTPSASPTRSPSPAASPPATRTATATPTRSPAPTQTPTGTPVPQTATPTAGPSATATSRPAPSGTPDPRYGVIVTSDSQHALSVLGITDYIDYTVNAGNIPAGKRKVLYVSTVNPVPVTLIQQAAAKAPGSVWYVLGEPNAHSTTVNDVLVGLHDTYKAIKEADPTALITSPSILNFSFTCINCSSLPRGDSWIKDFRDTYILIYGEEPPIDIWAIDVFPIAWPAQGQPASEVFPTVRSDIVIDQIAGYRQWLDSNAATRGKPIWVTEFGLHWGYSDWVFPAPDGCDTPAPAGKYETEKVENYLRTVYSWLEANSSAKNIQRWFTYTTYQNISTCQPGLSNGMTLFDSPGPDGELTDVGQFFWDWIHGVR